MKQKIFSPERSQLAATWGEMISEHGLADQCAKIAHWLKLYCGVSGTAFFIQDSRVGQKFVHADTVPQEILENLHAFLPHLPQAVEGDKEVVYLATKKGTLSVLDHDDPEAFPQQVVLATILSTKHHPIGVLALVAESTTVHSLVDHEVSSCWFSPLIANLLNNVISHTEKNRKINMLNLYQTVSSSLAHVGDLQELLEMIMSIVTSELDCEEGSVLMHDEESNEFEFFAAVGDTGKDLVKLRFPANKGIAGRALRERKALIVNDVASSPDFYGNIDEEHDFKTQSILATPLVSGEETVGVLEAINKMGGRSFDKDDAQILAAIADEVALAVKNARMFDYVVDSYCKIRQGQASCKGCKRPLKSWTPCVRYLDQQ